MSGKNEARIATALPFDPWPGPGVTSTLEGRKPFSMVEPLRGSRSAGEAVSEAAAGPANPASAESDADGTSAAGDDRSWFAVYLGQYPEGVAVPRQFLRDLAAERSTDAGNRLVPVSRAKRLRRRLEGRRASATKGCRSSQKLASQLKNFEELGLIRRDNARDAVIITDPGGLRSLGKASAQRMAFTVPPIAVVCCDPVARMTPGNGDSA